MSQIYFNANNARQYPKLIYLSDSGTRQFVKSIHNSAGQIWTVYSGSSSGEVNTNSMITYNASNAQSQQTSQSIVMQVTTTIPIYTQSSVPISQIIFFKYGQQWTINDLINKIKFNKVGFTFQILGSGSCTCTLVQSPVGIASQVNMQTSIRGAYGSCWWSGTTWFSSNNPTIGVTGFAQTQFYANTMVTGYCYARVVGCCLQANTTDPVLTWGYYDGN